jgi:hypothetical protein
MSDDPYNQRNPNSMFNATYPYNQATVTRGGHEFHVNDTPGDESLKLQHTQGTYVEFDKFGGLSLATKGKAHFYYNDGVSETVEGFKDVKISQNFTQNVNGDITDTNAGDRVVTTGGDLTIAAGSGTTIHSNEDLVLTAGGTLVINATDISWHVTGDHGFISTGDQNIGTATGDINMTAGGGGDVNISAPLGGSIQLTSSTSVVSSGATSVTLISPAVVELCCGTSRIVMTNSAITIQSSMISLLGGIITNSSVGAILNTAGGGIVTNAATIATTAAGGIATTAGGVMSDIAGGVRTLTAPLTSVL